MLTTGVDPFTQIYQAVIAQLKVYPGEQGNPLPAAAGGGNGLFQTIMDMTDPAFTRMTRMGSGDTPALRVSQNIAEFRVNGANSMIADFELDLHILVTTDLLNLVTINQATFMLICSLTKLPMDLGLSGLVRGFRIFQSQMQAWQPAKAKEDKEIDAAGSLRWSYAVSMRVDGYLSSVQMQESYPTVVPGT